MRLQRVPGRVRTESQTRPPQGQTVHDQQRPDRPRHAEANRRPDRQWQQRERLRERRLYRGMGAEENPGRGCAEHDEHQRTFDDAAERPWNSAIRAANRGEHDRPDGQHATHVRGDPGAKCRPEVRVQRDPGEQRRKECTECRRDTTQCRQREHIGRMAQAYRVRSDATDQQRRRARLEEIDERVADAHDRGESEREIGGDAAEQSTADNRTPAVAWNDKEQTSQQPRRRPHGAHARGYIEREPKPTQTEVTRGHPERNDDLSDQTQAGNS